MPHAILSDEVALTLDQMAECDRLLMIDTERDAGAAHCNGVAMKRNGSSSDSSSKSISSKLSGITFFSPRNAASDHFKAAAKGEITVLKALVDDDAGVLLRQDKQGWACLHHAAANDQTTIIDFLLNAGAAIDQLNDDGDTPLYVACEKGALQAVRHLLMLGANGNLINNRGFAGIHVATHNNQPEVIKILHEFPASVDIDKQSKNLGITGMHIAAYNDYVESLEVLVAIGCKYMSCYNGYFPIHIAATRGSVRALEFMLQKGEKLGFTREQMLSNSGACDNHSILDSAVNSGDARTVHLCLNQGADVTAKQKDGSTPFHHACSQGNLAVVKMMLEQHVEKSGPSEEAKRLACESLLESVDDFGLTPLHRAAVFNHASALEYLVSMGSAIDAEDNEGRTPLQLAAERGSAETMRALLSLNANVQHVDHQEKNVLHYAIGATNKCGAAAMPGGGHCGILELVQLICGNENGRNLLNCKDKNGHTPLHIASKEGNLNYSETLIKLGALVTIKDNDNQSPLHFAAMYGRYNTVRRLIESPFGPTIINETDSGGVTALHFACLNGHVKVVRYLLFRGAAIQKCHMGQTPLHEAARGGYVQTVNLLLSFHPGVLSQKDKYGNTALHVAAAENKYSVVEMLLSAGIDYSYNADNASPIDLAIDKRNIEAGLAMVQHERWREILVMRSHMYGCVTIGCIQFLPDVYKAILDQCCEKAPIDRRSPDYHETYNFKYLQCNLEDVIRRRKEGNNESVPLIALNRMVQCGSVELLSHPLCMQYLHMKWRAYGSLFFLSSIGFYLSFVTGLTMLLLLLDHTEHVQLEQLSNQQVPLSYPFGNGVINESVALQNGPILPHPNRTQQFAAFSSSFQRTPPTLLEQVLLIYLLFFIFVNVIKEIGQIYRERLQYFHDLVNYIEWTLYLTTLYFVLPGLLYNEFSHEQWQCAIIAIFLAWFNLLLYLQKLDFVGLYIIMFVQILKTMLKVILAFLALFVAFGLAFYIMLSYNQTRLTPYVGLKHVNGVHYDNVNGFHTPIISMMHTVMLMMGDWDFTGAYVRPLLDQDPLTLHYPVMSFVFVMIFIICMPILFINLFIGLAVGDIEMVQRDARLKRLAMEVAYYTDLELKLPVCLIKRFDKKETVIYPNRICGKKSWLSEILKSKLGVSCVDSNASDHNAHGDSTREGIANAIFYELEKQKTRTKELQTALDKQYQLLRLVVQKMEIHNEADNYDEGCVPSGKEEKTKMIQKYCLKSSHAGRNGSKRRNTNLGIVSAALGLRDKAKGSLGGSASFKGTAAAALATISSNSSTKRRKDTV